MTSRIFDLLKPVVTGFKTAKKLAVIMPYEDSILKALELACKNIIIKPVLIGDQSKIESLLKKYKFKCELVNEPDPGKGVEFVRNNNCDILMKGALNTDVLLHAILDKEKGLERHSIFSHSALFDIPAHDKLVIVTDAGVNISPDLTRKIAIIENSLKVARAVGVENPKVAVLAAVEKVIFPAMPATQDASLLKQMSEQGRFPGAVVDGPFALDNAISSESAKTKGIKSIVAGKADILLVPNIEAGNILYKSLTCFAGAKAASLVVGANIPLVVTSRTDDTETKFLSIMLAAAYSEKHEK
ncbi:MAG: hypothetical protein A2231_11745 [Candidatus Firestonebacteria bacterium RIFOXYA2_FULL_40_8]|nr:MAG: hypothetical protein A2231_11745 [Candidatus Firestonebacteria bacterium RIFOXYA2_FULL_40_8]